MDRGWKAGVVESRRRADNNERLELEMPESVYRDVSRRAELCAVGARNKNNRLNADRKMCAVSEMEASVEEESSERE